MDRGVSVVVGEENEEESPLEQLVAGVIMALVFLVGFGLLALGNPWFWIAFPVGFAGVLPAAMALVRLYESRQREEAEATDETEDALATLRRRYATGELSEEAFEQKVERLLETETVADARKVTDSRREVRDDEAVEFEHS
ncbi:SHOCT domain-containing protein [Haloferax sp. DFSO60]|uniref:SHOCT domain-containing protein n=1 Tax=Haloferax sp. DFSO60 TaxID=3388652 RepID=UPI00397B9E84